jgi:hypothetical protein
MQMAGGPEALRPSSSPSRSHADRRGTLRRFYTPSPERVLLGSSAEKSQPDHIFSNFGTVEVGASYSYTRRTIFPGVGGAPSTDENVVMFSFRYFPFQ